MTKHSGEIKASQMLSQSLTRDMPVNRERALWPRDRQQHQSISLEEERLFGMGILSATDGIGKHFSQEIDWMRKRKEIWLSRCWKIGLIGRDFLRLAGETSNSMNEQRVD